MKDEVALLYAFTQPFADLAGKIEEGSKRGRKPFLSNLAELRKPKARRRAGGLGHIGPGLWKLKSDGSLGQSASAPGVRPGDMILLKKSPAKNDTKIFRSQLPHNQRYGRG